MKFLHQIIFIVTVGFIFTQLGFAQNVYVLDLAAKHYFYVDDNASNDLDVTGDFTIEAWVNCADFTGRLCDRTGVCKIYATASSIRFDLDDGGGSISTGTVDMDVWNHIAVSRAGNSTRIFLNGEEKNSFDMPLVASEAPFYIGGQDTWFGAWNASIDEFRFSNVARYTDTFTPSVYGVQLVADDNTILLYNFNDNTEFPPSNLSDKVFTHTNVSIDANDYVVDSSLPLDGTSAISESDNTRVSTYKLGQNYPNPFNPTTSIPFKLLKASNVSLKVFDVTGKEVAELTNSFYSIGIHKVAFDASNLSSGVYIYRLQADDFVSVKKMTLMK